VVGSVEPIKTFEQGVIHRYMRICVRVCLNINESGNNMKEVDQI
jgi:hypothetical protein